MGFSRRRSGAAGSTVSLRGRAFALPLIVACILIRMGAFAVAENAEIADTPEAILAGMTLPQKVAQMIQPEIRWVTGEDVRRFGFGSILNGGGSFPDMKMDASVQDWLELAERFHAASVDRSLGSAGIPIIWGTDAVHGHGTVHGATVFPHNIGLGATRNAELVRAIGAATAREVRATGLDWIFAPTVAVATDFRWGRSYESFSSDPALVAALGRALVEGIQSEGIAATAKHFIGDGGTVGGVDQGEVLLARDPLVARHGGGYVSAIDAGVMTVMASFNSWLGHKVHGSRELLHTLLREEMGFEGVVVSDWNGVGQVRYCANDDCPQAINAGIDVVMAPRDWRPLLENTVAQVRAGEIPMARIDEAVLRILRLKARLGVLSGRSPSERRGGAEASAVGSVAHRALAARAVRESLVLLKNNGALLPLKAGQRLLVAGSAAHDIGRQSGGWTLTWQGAGTENRDFPGGTSIYAGLEAKARQLGGSAELSLDGSYRVRPDVAVVVFGEMPYAEGEGDVPHLNHGMRYPEDLQLLQRFRSQGIPTVGVYVTGRPAWINPELNASDAMVIAWLPGTEGGAVADVLYAEPGSEFDFRGRLPMPWPAHDLNAEAPAQPVATALFPIGFGLTLRDARELAALDTRAFARETNPESVVFERRSRPPWRMMLREPGAPPQPIRAATFAGRLGYVSVTAVDVDVQEDARQLAWHRAGPASVYWAYNGVGEWNVIADLDESPVLELRLSVDAPPAAEVTLSVACAPDCGGSLRIGAHLRELPIGEWKELLLPLSCFTAQGMDFRRVLSPLSLESEGPMTLTVSRVRFREGEPDDVPLSCDGLEAGRN